MGRTRISRRTGYLERYNPSEVYLQKPNRQNGTPGILEGTSPSGDPLLIRVWPRSNKANDEDLIDIWRNELRVLHRLGGASGAEEYIARLVDAGEDASGFYIVIAAGQRRPLATLIAQRQSGSDWLKITSSPRNRKRLWANLGRIAMGLEVLHNQGLIHCNFNTWSVLSTGDSEPDFQLTGFEWSMRLMASNANAKRTSKDPQKTISFLDDWKDFARLSAGLLDINFDRLADFQIPHYDVAEHVTAEEAWLLRELLYPSPLVRIDGGYIAGRIEEIRENLDSAAAAEEPQFQLVLSLGRESKLSRAIREASDLTIDVDDITAQISFITADLAKPRIIALGKQDNLDIVLRGIDLVYRLRKYTVPRSSEPTWEFAVCERAELGRDFIAPILAEDSLPPNSLRLMTFAEASTRTPRVRGRVLNWDSVRARLMKAAPLPSTREQRVLRALTLLHAVELVSAAAEVFPVKIRMIPNQPGSSQQIEITLQPDADREKLAEALNLRPSEQRLEQLLEREVADDEGWRLAEARALGRRAIGDIELQYERTVQSTTGSQFIFRITSTAVTIPVDGILIPGEFRGRLSQFRRRAKAITSLQNHTELLRMLSDPRGGLSESHDKVSSDDDLGRLDNAKKGAYRELSAVLPLYVVQGPPGVGKTYLVREVVQRKFSEDNTARLLLTAQSHYAVDHLMTELQKDWKDSSRAPLAIRCRAIDEGDITTEFDLRSKSNEILSSLYESNLGSSCSERLRKRLGETIMKPGDEKQQVKISERRLVDGLVMRSANAVFATTNSGDLERLLEERGQFDWAIIEEAGKATGVDLLLPLLLSYRRLMIGDHKQLPPFGSEKLDKLLSAPIELRSAIKLGLELVERALRDIIPDDLQELFDANDSEEIFANLCGEARRMLYLFETIVEAEMGRQKRPSARGLPIARKLDIQHRMHPDIAKLVARCFYDKDLETSDESKAAFKNLACPIISDNPLLRDSPIVLIDLPYERAKKGLTDVERYPRYTNDIEVKAVCQLLRGLEGRLINDKLPSLAVLSPYLRQVNRLKEAILDDSKVRSALETFQPVGMHSAWCSTVDAFQGNEADAVIISLVRNNHHATARKALGFISDPRRMNVLLSRAKWRLYIVTSLKFLRTVVEPVGQEKSEDVAFLREMLTALAEYEIAGIATRVDGDELLESSR